MARPPVALERRLEENLDIGGARKIGILRAIAAHWGYDRSTFERAVRRLKTAKKIVEFRQYGGPHLRARAHGLR